MSSSFSSSSDAIWIGIDIAKATMDVALGATGEVTTYANTGPGHRKLGKRLATLAVAGIVLEATGPYHLTLVETLQAAGWRPSVINPQRIAAYRRSTGKRAKNDQDDARLLAQFGAQQQPVAARVATAQERLLRELVARREDLVGVRTAEKTRQHVAREAAVKTTITRHLAWLDAEITALNAEIDACIAADPAMAERRAILQSMRGIGPVISAVLVAYLPELGEMSRRQIAALAGLAPYDQDSGAHRGQRRIAGGRPLIRRAMFLAAHAIMHRDTVFRAQRMDMEQQHKPRKVIVIAIARRMLGILNAMARDGLMWEQTDVAQGRYPRPGKSASVPLAA